MKEIKKPLRENLSKRIIGGALIGVAMAMAITLFIHSLKDKIGDPETAMTLIKSFLTAGVALFGVSIFDYLKKKSQ